MRPWSPRTLGLDLSLTGTGICRIEGGRVAYLGTVRPGSLKGHERLDAILESILTADRVGSGPVDLVVIEGPSYGSNSSGQRGHHERAGLWWLVAHGLFSHGRPYAVASPKSRAKYGSGDGNANKAKVKAAVRATYEGIAYPANDNEADALALAAAGADHLGGALVDLPKTHRDALARIEWPETPADEE